MQGKSSFKASFSFVILFFLFVAHTFGQQFTPIVKQFSKKDYSASNQNWAVGQTSDGLMYFGNNQGLLEFDGNLWQTIKMPQNKIVRSLYIDSKNRIYVGSFEEFGYYDRDETGHLSYKSLSDQLTKYKMLNDEIWDIRPYKNFILFQSFTSYFFWDGKKVTGYRTPYTFLFFTSFKNDIYSYVYDHGFNKVAIEKNKIEPLPNTAELQSPVIASLYLDRQHVLLVTKSNGLFIFDGEKVSRFQTNIDEELKKTELNRAVMSKNGIILLGSILNGVTAINKSGQKLWTLNTSNVLQNNTVLGMYCDKDNNVWLSLDKGISVIHLNSSLRYIRSFSPSVGSIYSISYNPPTLYMGTNQGLYAANYNREKQEISNVHLVQGIKGQIWDLSDIDGQLFCGNNEETLEITNGNPHVVSPVKGGFCLKKGTIHGQEVLVQGTYSEISIYVKKDGRWIFSHSIQGFLNPIRYLEIDYTGTIWAAHMHQGLYEIHLSPDLHKIESQKLYKSLDNKNQYTTNVFSINNRVVFTNGTRFFTFDDINKKIIPYAELNKSLGTFTTAYRVSHFRNNQYWFIKDSEAALVEISNKGVKVLNIVQYSLFMNQTVDDYQNIIPITNDECIFTLENGLALYKSSDDGKYKSPVSHLQIKSVETTNDEATLSQLISLDNTQIPEIPYSKNNVTFTVYFPDYSQLDNLYYRYKLNGLDKVWSEPLLTSKKRYNYLPYGKYRLEVEVLTKSGIRLGKTSYQFEVLPPFYLSGWAKAFYFILLLLLLYGIYIYLTASFQKKREKFHKEQEEINRKEIEKREQQIMTLEKAKLESELTLKSKELAESTMTLIKKNELLVNIKEEVTSHKEALGNQYPNKYYDKLIRLLDENLTSEDDWAIFQANFDRIHENFFRNLKTKYPELTSNDLRFCAYLRLNLTSKDIAHLMNISLKGVEVGRYRIRKKIGLPSTKSLTEFMIEFK